ncbi:gustatory receptor for sugar taste 64f-like [Copidosoma floridanum]|uniref:gustatory receptor for sugar taste 64f-like n=1 Tax=Copidosoma floridanum TaxID=29053 RepID=UPI000C6F9CA6|nr:gustatory receptor for sugar taste 64f-like [Copidosoma floridanum]
MSELRFRATLAESPQHGRYETFKMDSIPIDASRSSASNSGANLIESTRSFHCALKPIVTLAQCFAVFPVDGVQSSDASSLKFTWKSFKVLYCCLSATGSIVLTMFSVYRLATTSITSSKTSNLVFFFTAGITVLLFLKLSRQWPSFAVSWENMERELAARHNSRRLNAISLILKFKILSAVVMILALVEHTLSILSGYVSAIECAHIRGHSDIVATYFSLQFPQIFTETNYANWKGVIVQYINILSTFSWSFMDLFLILISVALTDQFKQLNHRLYSIRGKHCFVVKAMPEWWWAEARVDFNRLAAMTRRVDDKISDIVMLSFSTNLYFICIQLLNSFKPLPNAIQTVYFCFSFGFLLSRTVAVSLYAASVHDESLLPAPILYSVCSASYSAEVRRFLNQVTTDHVSLTGMKFFSITRSLILTVAGTIVTYELILVQFNAVQSDHQHSVSNITKICESPDSSITDVKIEERYFCFLIAEHILSILSGYARSVQCARNHGNIDVANVYFILKFPELFTKHNYALWKAFIIKVVNIISTFSWTFIDLFLILMSVSLTDQFKYFNRRLYTTFDKIMPEDWWTEARKDFNYLATITRKVDSEISSIVLLSFSANLYFICIQLLNSFNPMPNVIHRIYFCFSFGFLLLRTVAVSLYAANIHEESLLPASVLYNVETTSFSIEVERFLSQVTTDHISLTGMKFFSVTRSLILTVVGTIVTYELVLMQFNSIQDDQQENSSNMTKVCNLK